MSTISSGVGLVSGLDIESLVNSMIAADQAPIALLQERVSTMVTQRTTFLQLSAQLLAIQNAASRFEDREFFQRTSATSSNESAMLATADVGAAIGQYTFTVKNLASTHQLISSGFATRDSSYVGAGVLTFEGSDALINRSTDLSTLNAGEGVRVGKMRITDRSGTSTDVDLTTARTVQDVVKAISYATNGNVEARAEGDHLVLEDKTGLTTGLLTVTDIGTGRTAEDLGILGSSSSGSITGQNLVQLSTEMSLSDLNDGNGIRSTVAQPDFSVTLADGSAFEFDLSEYLTSDTSLDVLNRGHGVPAGTIHVTNRAGLEADIDLSSAETIGDVKAAIENAGLNLSVTFSGNNLLISDSSGGDGSLTIEDVGDGLTADALGIANSVSSNTLTGADIYTVETLGDVMRIINTHADNDDGAGGRKLDAAISADGTHITLTDNTTGTGVFEVAALNDSKAAEDLGILNAADGNTITSHRLMAGLDTVLLRSLNGGQGVELGTIQIQDRAGSAPVTVDLIDAETMADILRAINEASPNITASVSSSGLGIEIKDTSGGTGNLSISDVTGSVAADLNIAFDGAESTINSGNLQRQYVSGATRLDSFGTNGVPAGQFRITNSRGETAVVDLTQGNEKTLQDVISEINSRGLDVVARINDTGDGLLLEDQAGGTGLLKVTEEGGSTAKALGILGEAKEGETTINGTLEKRVTITNQDTLNDVLDKIRSSGANVNAAVINDGSSSHPFRLSLTSTTSGIDGQMAIDTGSTGLSFNTLIQARDATVVFGSSDADEPLILSSSTNTLDDAVSGVSIELIAPSDTPTTISVTQNIDAVVQDLSTFVTAYNTAMSTLDSVSSYDTETETRSILTGDATIRRVRQQLMDMAVGTQVPGLPTSMNRLSQVGITFQSGGTLLFDESVFREAYERDPEAVVELFTHEETNEEGETVGAGLGAMITSVMERLTNEDTGIVPVQTQNLRDSEALLNDRIEQMTTLLERRRERYLAEFYAMEDAIAELQSQQSALTELAALSTTG